MTKQDKFFRRVTSVLVTVFLIVGTVAMYENYNALLVTFFLLLLAAVWYGSGKE